MNKNTAGLTIFSIEDGLVTALWIHERPHTGKTIPQITTKFQLRFQIAPLFKRTLLTWELKRFTTRSVKHARRTGRPLTVNEAIMESPVTSSVSVLPNWMFAVRP